MNLSFNNTKMGPLRALFAIVILLGHFSYFMWAPTLKYMRLLAPPSVAMFMFISGYGLTKSVMVRGKSYLADFPLTKTLRIIFPALLVTLLHVLLGFGGGVMPMERMKMIFLRGDTLLPHYWFVWYIIGAYVVFWICHKTLPLKAVKYVSLGTSMAFVLYARFASFDWCWWMCALSIPAGVAYAEHEQKLYDFCSKGELRYWLTVSGLAVLMVLFYITPFVILRTFTYALFTILLALLIARLPIDKVRFHVLRFLGSISYEIFLVHITIMGFLRGRQIDIVDNVPYLIVATTAVVLTAWVIHHISTGLIRIAKR